jgi:outer membrane receptor protein involved in Fe transport
MGSARRMTRRSVWLAAGTLAALLPGHRSDAQSATAQPATAAPAASGPTEEITVTAERRRQDVQTVGASISVLSGRQLAVHNVNDAFDLQYQTPSLQVTPQFGSGQLEYAIRGVGFEDYASNNAPTVGLYIDEVAFPIPYETNGQIFDVQRVEVLRGPQGTLYGRNTTGGAINYVLNKPTQDFTGGLTVQYGRFDSALVEGYLSGAIGPDLQMRVAGETQQGGAWQHGPDGSLLGNADRSSLRTLIDWEPTDTLKIEADLHGSHDRSDGLGTYLYAPNTAQALEDIPGAIVTPVDPNRDDTVWGTSPAFAREIGISPDSKPFSHIDTAGISLRADQTIDAGTITDLVSYDYAGRREYDDFDASELALADVYFNTRANVFANELRFTSNQGERLTYVLGLYYGNQYLADNYRGGFDQIYGVDTSVRYAQKVDTVSGFGQASIKLTQALTLTGGARIEYEQRRLLDFGSFFLEDGVVVNPNNSVGVQSTSYVKPSGKIELQYVPFGDDMIYAEVSRGIKSGGFTTYNTTSPKIGTAPFQPERLLAYEIGNKLDLPAADLRFNVSAFYYDYHDEQIQAAVLNPTTGLIGSIVNAPRSHLYGGEIEASWTPIRNLTLAQSVGEAIGAFDMFSSLLSDVRQNGVFVGIYRNRAGEALPAPKFTANGSITYRFELGRDYLSTGIDYSLRTTYNSLFGSLYNVAGYTLFNAHATFGPRDGKWTLTAYGQNIFDKRYDIDRNFFDAGDDIATAGLPATYGLRAAINF